MCDILITNAVKESVAKFGTPLYLYDIDGMCTNIDRLKKSMAELFSIALSVKANPNPNLLGHLHDSVKYLDVTSLGEILLAEMAGVDPARMIFVGPGKSHEELRQAVSYGLKCVVLESLAEAYQLQAITLDMDQPVSVILRINPDISNNSSGYRMGGAASQFGVDEKNATAVIKTISDLPGLNFIGIHSYLGTQFLDAHKLVDNFAYLFSLSLRLQKTLNLEFEIMDFGGGFGIPYFANENQLDMALIEESIPALMAAYQAEMAPSIQQEFIIESGRFIFGDCGYYCTSVLYCKFSRDERFVVVDGGSNFHASLAGQGKLLRRNFPFHVINSEVGSGSVNIEPSGPDNPESAGGSNTYNIAGPLCLPLDILAKNVAGHAPNPGDIIVFENSGAYGLSFSPSNFLSHLGISEVGLQGGSLACLKRPKTKALLELEYAVG